MSAAFSRTLRSLSVDSARRPLWVMALGASLLLAWCAWFSLVRIAVWEVTPSARLEVLRAVHHVDAPMAGRVVATTFALGEEVTAGAVLAELDAETERLTLREQRARLDAVGPQVEALRRELAAEVRGVGERREASLSAIREAQARQREADAQARLAAEEWSRVQRLQAQRFVSESEAARAQADAQSRRAGADALALAVTRMQREQRSEESARMARIARLEGEIARLEGERASASAAIASNQHQITRRTVRAPVTGRVARVAELRVGSVVREGERLAEVVPRGALRVVARFPTSAALGRIRVGQPGRVRLDGFPWAVYGTVGATVTRVASEPQEGMIRVELEVRREGGSEIPLEHGLQGAVEVQVDRLSPAALVLRAAGRRLFGDAPARATPGGV